MGASPEDLQAAQEFVRRLSESGDLPTFMDAQQDQLTPVLADNLRVLAGEALKAGAFEYVSFVGNLGGSVNLRIGRKAEALACHLLALQADFHRAETVEEYRTLRCELLQTEKRAEAVQGSEQTRFEARGFAVQCGYFACDAAASPEPAETLIRESLEDLVALLEQQPSPLPPERIQLFMEFAFPTLDLATARMWLDRTGGIAAAISRIAAAVENAVPAEAALAKDASRDAAMAEVLARLAVDHGS